MADKENGPSDLQKDATQRQRRIFRPKNAFTAFVLISFFGLGMVRGQEGVALLDLLIIIREDLETGSLLFLFSAPGFLVGALVGGILFDRLDPHAVYTLCLLFMGLISFVIPFCPSLVIMGIALLCRSLFAGAIDAGGTFLFALLWRTKANPYIQALHFLFALGALTVPFVTEPFMAPDVVSGKNSNRNNTGRSSNNNSGSLGIGNWNHTAEYYWNLNSDSEQTNASSKDDNGERTTDVYISFLIVGGFIIISSIPFLYQHAQKIKNPNTTESRLFARHTTNSVSLQLREGGPKKPILYQICAYVLIGLIYGTYGCVEKGCATFLMPYAVEHVHWDKISGARLVAAFWGAFAAFRFLAIGFAKVTSEFQMLLADFIVLVGGSCLFLLASPDTEVVVWIASVVVGSAQAGIYPTAAAWINKHISRVTGVLAALLTLSVAAGSMINLPLLGYLFEEHSPVWFTYLSIAFSLLCFSSFIVLHCSGKMFKEVPTQVNIELMKPSENNTK